jgi:hypothetical protein
MVMIQALGQHSGHARTTDKDRIESLQGCESVGMLEDARNLSWDQGAVRG